VAAVVLKKWRVGMRKLPDHQRIDYAMVRDSGEVAALCEIKCRKFIWGDFPDVVLSASKVLYSRQIWREFELQTMFVVRDRSGDIRYAPIHVNHSPIKYGGRTVSPRDSQDSEMVVHIPNSVFKPLNPVH